jgi:hypothetical protein
MPSLLFQKAPNLIWLISKIQRIEEKEDSKVNAQ